MVQLSICTAVLKSLSLLFSQLHPVLILIGLIVLGGEGNYDAFSIIEFLKQIASFRACSVVLICLLMFPSLYILNAGIMTYKVLPLRKEAKKLIHLVLNAIALILGVIGIYAAFKYHNESNIPNLYSLHSWLGIGIIVLFGIQVILLRSCRLKLL